MEGGQQGSLTDMLGECQQALGEADKQERADKLDKLMNRFGEALELSDREIRDILRDQEEISDAMRRVFGEYQESVSL